MTRTALVTGASSGIGLATALALSERGYRVIGTSRDPDRQNVPGVEFVRLDLADDASIEALAGVLATVDVLVDNAGESESGPFEDLTGADIRRQFQVNVFAPVRLAQLALPGMRERGYGRVIMVGSMVASFPLAYRSAYVAAKAALKGFANAARPEFSPFGIAFSTVEPGSIRTGVSDRRVLHSAEGSVHTGDFRTMLAAMDRNERAGTPPEKVAATIIKAIEARKPRPRYATGSRAPLVFTLKWLLSQRAMERLVQRNHDLSR